jgi:4-hydroxy-3-methylbut-2-enyl diphosphate reductase
VTALVVVPLLAERVALGRVPGVLRVGAGPRRAAAAADRIRSELGSGRYTGLLIAGTCGGLAEGLRPGDLVVASELDGHSGRCADPAPLAAALRASARLAGRSVHIGRVHTAGHIVDGAERAALAATGAIAVDTESAPLAAAAGDHPVLVVRAVSDTAAHPLRSVGIVRNGLSALRSLRAAAPVLAGWPVAAAVRLDVDEAEREVG